jgi:uncharacterized LabA/DUF88 family protein
MKRKNNAIYIDLENIPGNLDLKSLFDELTLKHNADENEENIFVIKMACGNAASIKKIEKKLAEYNFTIRDTPAITTQYKNRADLIISLDALETIIINNPAIERFIFITSDSDFSVIMETLRKYGKEVYLVTKESVSTKPIFNNCCDEILIIEEYLPKQKTEETKATVSKSAVSQEPASPEKNDRFVEELIVKVLEAMDPDSWQLVSYVGIKFHQMDKSRIIGRSKYRKLSTLLEKLEKDKVIERKLNEKGHPMIKMLSI